MKRDTIEQLLRRLGGVFLFAPGDNLPGDAAVRHVARIRLPRYDWLYTILAATPQTEI